MNMNMFGAGTIEPPTNKLIARAASLTSFYIEFYQLIKTKKLEPLMLNKVIPMDMSQFNQLFCTTRTPGPDGDSLVTRKDSDFIAVNHR